MGDSHMEDTPDMRDVEQERVNLTCQIVGEPNAQYVVKLDLSRTTTMGANHKFRKAMASKLNNLDITTLYLKGDDGSLEELSRIEPMGRSTKNITDFELRLLNDLGITTNSKLVINIGRITQIEVPEGKLPTVTFDTEKRKLIVKVE